MILFFRFNIRLIYTTEVCDEKIYDSQMITANDFTVKIKVTDEMTEKFEKEHKPTDT